MRTTLKVGLAVSAALFCLSLGNAGSAKATSTALCQIGELVCPTSEDVYSNFITMLAKSPRFLTEVGTVECGHSMISATALGLGSPQVSHVTLIDFTGSCKVGLTSCAISTKKVGTLLFLKTGNNSGTLQPHGTEFLVNCPGIVHCVLGGLAKLTVAGADSEHPMEVSATNLPMEPMSGLLCPEVINFDATYAFTQPQQKLYISQ